MTEPDFSDPWFRKTFRTDLRLRNFRWQSESLEDSFIRLTDWLELEHVTLSSSGKTAYDQNGRANNLTNTYWPNRKRFVDWAQANKQPIFKKRTKAVHNGRVTTPATKKPTKPTTTGWDDFDWSV